MPDKSNLTSCNQWCLQPLKIKLNASTIFALAVALVTVFLLPNVAHIFCLVAIAIILLS
jgi:hypothetical protein